MHPTNLPLKALKFSYQPPAKDENIFPRTNIQEMLPVKASTAYFAPTASTYREDEQRGQGGELPDSPREFKPLFGGVSVSFDIPPTEGSIMADIYQAQDTGQALGF